MPTNRNNEIKEFAIGTKIEYNGKLYEVVEELFCDNCSIANICTNAEFTNIKKSDNLLSRERIYSIFGECSNYSRADGTSVVFKELPTSKEPKVYNTVLYEIDYNHKYITIDIPEGFIIDTENSDLAKGIVKFKKKYITYDDILQACSTNFSGLRIHNHCINKIIAISQLMNIAKYYNEDWEPDWNNQDEYKYSIVYNRDTYKVDYSWKTIFSSIYFKNKKDAQAVIDNPNFREVLDSIFKV